MRENQKFKDKTNDLDLVDEASKYGVSSKSEDRGIGLYLLKDVAMKNDDAKLTIVSQKAMVEYGNLDHKKTDLNHPFPGTIN